MNSLPNILPQHGYLSIKVKLYFIIRRMKNVQQLIMIMKIIKFRKVFIA